MISLSIHDIDIYAGGEPIPEGELWIKRNCIRLKKKPDLGQDDPNASNYYIFCDNCSEKEDFYHALLRSHDRDVAEEAAAPQPLPFETDDMIKLIRQLHDSQENSQSRWLNALLGRLFLALYKTSEIENFVRNKITKKVSRVAKPNFITSIKLQDVDMGDSGPSFMNPKLREMTVDGSLTLEADVRYFGNFKAVIAAVARIELGSKLKAREVNMILAGILRKLEGHVLFKIKPPPSNRIWMSFEIMPKLDISLEPIVSSRQITYGVVLRPLINRIKEVVAETVVLPNWDDIPFMNTEDKPYRAGIWKGRGAESFTDAEKEAHRIAKEADDNKPARSSSMPPNIATTDTTTESIQSGTATPAMSPSVSPSPKQRRATVDRTELPESASTPSIAQVSGTERPPKAMRSNSFATAASPVISKSPAATEGARRRPKKGSRDAASAMKDLATRSPELSPITSPIRGVTDGKEEQPPELPPRPLDGTDEASLTNGDSVAQTQKRSEAIKLPKASDSPTRLRAASMTDPTPSASRTSGLEKTKALNQSLTSATAAATKWTLGMLNTQNEKGHAHSKSIERSPNREPMGRGQPLPPPGMPLPKPEKNTWGTAAFNTLRRKPVNSSAAATDSSKPAEAGTPETKPQDERTISLPTLNIDPPAEQRDDGSGDNIMTISAPQESAPSTPRPQTPEPEYARQLSDQAMSSPMTGT